MARRRRFRSRMPHPKAARSKTPHFPKPKAPRQPREPQDQDQEQEPQEQQQPGMMGDDEAMEPTSPMNPPQPSMTGPTAMALGGDDSGGEEDEGFARGGTVGPYRRGPHNDRIDQARLLHRIREHGHIPVGGYAFGGGVTPNALRNMGISAGGSPGFKTPNELRNMGISAGGNPNQHLAQGGEVYGDNDIIKQSEDWFNKHKDAREAGADVTDDTGYRRGGPVQARLKDAPEPDEPDSDSDDDTSDTDKEIALRNKYAEGGDVEIEDYRRKGQQQPPNVEDTYYPADSTKDVDRIYQAGGGPRGNRLDRPDTSIDPGGQHTDAGVSAIVNPNMARGSNALTRAGDTLRDLGVANPYNDPNWNPRTDPNYVSDPVTQASARSHLQEMDPQRYGLPGQGIGERLPQGWRIDPTTGDAGFDAPGGYVQSLPSTWKIDEPSTSPQPQATGGVPPRSEWEDIVGTNEWLQKHGGSPPYITEANAPKDHILYQIAQQRAKDAKNPWGGDGGGGRTYPQESNQDFDDLAWRYYLQTGRYAPANDLYRFMESQGKRRRKGYARGGPVQGYDDGGEVTDDNKPLEQPSPGPTRTPRREERQPESPTRYGPSDVAEAASRATTTPGWWKKAFPESALSQDPSQMAAVDDAIKQRREAHGLKDLTVDDIQQRLGSPTQQDIRQTQDVQSAYNRPWYRPFGGDYVDTKATDQMADKAARTLAWNPQTNPMANVQERDQAAAQPTLNRQGLPQFDTASVQRALGPLGDPAQRVAGYLGMPASQPLQPGVDMSKLNSQQILDAVAGAHSNYGTDKSSPLLGHLQNGYTGLIGIARAAVNNRDPETAARILNRASDLVPNGEDFHVTPGQNGTYDVMVTDRDGKKMQYNISDRQMNEFLSSNASEWNHMRDNGMNRTMDISGQRHQDYLAQRQQYEQARATLPPHVRQANEDEIRTELNRYGPGTNQEILDQVRQSIEDRQARRQFVEDPAALGRYQSDQNLVNQGFVEVSPRHWVPQSYLSQYKYARPSPNSASDTAVNPAAAAQPPRTDALGRPVNEYGVPYPQRPPIYVQPTRPQEPGRELLRTEPFNEQSPAQQQYRQQQEARVSEPQRPTPDRPYPQDYALNRENEIQQSRILHYIPGQRPENATAQLPPNKTIEAYRAAETLYPNDRQAQAEFLAKTDRDPSVPTDAERNLAKAIQDAQFRADSSAERAKHFKRSSDVETAEKSSYDRSTDTKQSSRSGKSSQSSEFKQADKGSSESRRKDQSSYEESNKAYEDMSKQSQAEADALRRIQMGLPSGGRGRGDTGEVHPRDRLTAYHQATQEMDKAVQTYGTDVTKWPSHMQALPEIHKQLEDGIRSDQQGRAAPGFLQRLMGGGHQQETAPTEPTARPARQVHTDLRTGAQIWHDPASNRYYIPLADGRRRWLN